VAASGGATFRTGGKTPASSLAMLSDVPPGEKKHIVLTIGFEGDAKLAVPVESGLCGVNSIEIDGYFYYDESRVPIRRYLYRTGSGTITENAEATIVSGESRVTIGFHATTDGATLGLTVRSTGDTPPHGMDLTFELRPPCGLDGQPR
jgi:hypothetical protein